MEEIITVADEIIKDIIQHPDVIYNLSSIRSKDEGTYSHSLNVCALSVILAFKLKLPRKKVREIAIGSLLHDIGYTFITMDYSNLILEECTEKEQKELKNMLFMDIRLWKK